MKMKTKNKKEITLALKNWFNGGDREKILANLTKEQARKFNDIVDTYFYHVGYDGF